MSGATTTTMMITNASCAPVTTAAAQPRRAVSPTIENTSKEEPRRGQEENNSLGQEKKTTKEREPMSFVLPVVRPKRPLTAYNLFFRYERARLLTLKKKQQQVDDDDARRTPANLTPQSIRLLLSDHPYQIDRTKRRRHRKSHGALSFRELSDHASRNWKVLDSVSRESFDALAREHKDAYDEEMAEYSRAVEEMELRRYGEAREAEGVEPEGRRAADAEEERPRKKAKKMSRRHPAMAKVVSSSSLTCTSQQEEEAKERPPAREAYPNNTLFIAAPSSSPSSLSPPPQIVLDGSAPRVPHIVTPVPFSSPDFRETRGGGVYSRSRASANKLMNHLMVYRSWCETKRPSSSSPAPVPTAATALLRVEEDREMVAFMGGLDWSRY